MLHNELKVIQVEYKNKVILTIKNNFTKNKHCVIVN